MLAAVAPAISALVGVARAEIKSFDEDEALAAASDALIKALTDGDLAAIANAYDGVVGPISQLIEGGARSACAGDGTGTVRVKIKRE